MKKPDRPQMLKIASTPGLDHWRCSKCWATIGTDPGRRPDGCPDRCDQPKRRTKE